MIRRTAVVLVLVASCGLMLVGCGGGGEEAPAADAAPVGYATPEALARAWLDALASGDLEAGKRCYMRLDDLPAMAAALEAEEDTPEESREGLEAFVEKGVAEFPELFETCLWYAEARGLDLSKAEIVSVNAETEPVGDLLVSDIDFVFRVDDQLYGYNLDDSVKFSRGWVAVEEPSGPYPISD
jgi:hypothetical protein